MKNHISVFSFCRIHQTRVQNRFWRNRVDNDWKYWRETYGMVRCTYDRVKKCMQKFGLKHENGEATWRPGHMWEGSIVSNRKEVGVRVRIGDEWGDLVNTVTYTVTVFVDTTRRPVFIKHTTFRRLDSVSVLWEKPTQLCPIGRASTCLRKWAPTQENKPSMTQTICVN
jgi:hypothetical protein